MLKRAFDIVFSIVGLLVLMPLFFAIATAILLADKPPIFFTQARVGRRGCEFFLYKFRTMRGPVAGPLLTSGGDPRITPLGRWLRRYKLDELPQLVNVLKGDMSFVGPRPEVLKFVKIFQRDYEKILTVRPGLTDAASIRFKDESTLLTGENPEDLYIGKVLPAKIKYYLDYVEHRNLAMDINLIFQTLAAIWRPSRARPPLFDGDSIDDVPGPR